MNDFKCLFCFNLATPAPQKKLDAYGIYVRFCHKCMVEYISHEDRSKVNYYSLYTTINDKVYRWTVSTLERPLYAWLRHVQNPGIPGYMINKDMVVIKRFKDDIPNITPQNINEKVKTYLIFL